MTTATKNEDDLIIIWNDNDLDESILDFDFWANTSNKSIDSWLTFLDDDKSEVLTDFSLDGFWTQTTQSNEIIENSTKQESAFDIDFWFWNSEDVILDEPTTQENQLVEDVQLESTQEDFLIWSTTLDEEISTTTTQSFDSVVKEDITPVMHTQGKTWNIFDRNSILDEAIAKMQSRKTTIWDNKSKKQEDVNKLEENIKQLTKQVSELEKSIKELEIEDSALDLDITSIEKMKSSILESSVDRPRKHNLGNIKK